MEMIWMEWTTEGYYDVNRIDVYLFMYTFTSCLIMIIGWKKRKIKRYVLRT